MSYGRVFTIEQVEALVPALSLWVGEQLRVHGEIQRGLGELESLTGSLPTSLEVLPGDGPEVVRLKGTLRACVVRYQSGWQRLQALGAVIQDPELGLLDFHGQVEGRPVWLCWRYGEESLGYYHELDAGYAERRPLRGAVRQQSLN
jgi:hypothetical protein